MFEKIIYRYHGRAFAALTQHYITLDAVGRRELEAVFEYSFGSLFLAYWRSWRRQEA